MLCSQHRASLTHRFSRKDALRRHWLVKGCRGEDGATAPISAQHPYPMCIPCAYASAPIYPLNAQPPALSPPTPPQNISPIDGPADYANSMPYAHPPLGSLAARHQSDNLSQVIVTPNDLDQHEQMHSRAIEVASTVEDAAMIDPSLGGVMPGGDGTDTEGYFEGVVGLKQDGTAMIKPPNDYARYTASPPTSIHPHPYRRPNGMANGQQGSPNPYTRYPASGYGQDGKPVFGMSFPQHAMLAPPMDGTKMEKQGSTDGSDPATWQRW